VAAFSEAAKARETRLSLEAAGFKTYSQAVDTPKGKVWRVRVGPVDTRAKADALKAKIVQRGFSPAVIEL
jgi:DedD protein